MSELVAPQPETSFHFVLCEHTPDNADMVAESLSDCDIIAFESVGGDPDWRRMQEAVFTIYTAKSTTEQERGEVEELYDKAGYKIWNVEVLKHFPETDKKVVLIDAGENDLAYSLVEQADEASDEYRKKLLEDAPVEELEGLLRKKLLLNARSIIHRERLVVRQLERLAEEHPGSRIGVVLGALHTGVQHFMDISYPTDRRFVVPSSDKSGWTTIDHKPENHAIRQLRFSFSKGLGEQALKTVLLHDLMVMAAGISVPSTELKKIGAEELDSVIAAVDQIRRSDSVKPDVDS